jgi:hypothetical protein
MTNPPQYPLSRNLSSAKKTRELNKRRDVAEASFIPLSSACYEIHSEKQNVARMRCTALTPERISARSPRVNSPESLYPCTAELFALLGNRRRLFAIKFLAMFEIDASLEVREIARFVRGAETSTSPRLVSTDDYESAYNGLIQTHLPKLAIADVIEYDDRAKEVIVTRRVKQYAGICSLVECFSMCNE